jgi:hypothetical protein
LTGLNALVRAASNPLAPFIYDQGEALNKPGLMSLMTATALTVIFGHDSPSTAKKPA